MKKLIEFLAKSVVDKEDSVLVTEEQTENGNLIKLSVDPDDMGKVIGKKGRTIKAFRDLLRIKTVKNGKRAYLELTEKS